MTAPPLHPLTGAFDLGAVRNKLALLQGCEGIVSLIDRCTDQRSVGQDLRDAVQALNVLLAMGPGGPLAPAPQGDDVIRQALVVHLVMLYARATHSQDLGRPKKGGLGKAYSPALRAAHARMMTLRNKVMAHRGTAGEQDWADDRLVVQINNGSISYRALFDRKILTQESLRDLKELLPAAAAHYEAAASQSEKEMHERMFGSGSDDAILHAAIEGSAFDPKGYFGEGALAENFHNDGETGEAFAQVRWTRTP